MPLLLVDGITDTCFGKEVGIMARMVTFRIDGRLGRQAGMFHAYSCIESEGFPSETILGIKRIDIFRISVSVHVASLFIGHSVQERIIIGMDARGQVGVLGTHRKVPVQRIEFPGKVGTKGVHQVVFRIEVLVACIVPFVVVIRTDLLVFRIVFQPVCLEGQLCF